MHQRWLNLYAYIDIYIQIAQDIAYEQRLSCAGKGTEHTYIHEHTVGYCICACAVKALDSAAGISVEITGDPVRASVSAFWREPSLLLLHVLLMLLWLPLLLLMLHVLLVLEHGDFPMGVERFSGHLYVCMLCMCMDADMEHLFMRIMPCCGHLYVCAILFTPNPVQFSLCFVFGAYL